MKNIRKIVVPIEIRALKTANIYKIEDSGILIDSGMSNRTIASLNDDGVKLDDLKMLVLTHLHIDHVGGAMALRRQYGMPIAMGKRDALTIQSMQDDPEGYWGRILSFLSDNGVPKSVVEHEREMFSDQRRVDVYAGLSIDRILKEENIDSNVSVIENPGHTMGSISILLRDSNAMFVGDHIISKITPNISSYTFENDMLGYYMDSLEKIKGMKPKIIFPGHREEIRAVGKRIDEIKAHHYSRLKEIEEICLDGWKSSYEVAGEMRWSRNRSMKAMNVMETTFAVGEAISHLVHLYNLERIDLKDSGKIVKWKTI